MQHSDLSTNVRWFERLMYVAISADLFSFVWLGYRLSD